MAATEPTARDRELLARAIRLAERCPAGPTFSVGAVIADADGVVLATGYSREADPVAHAEETALGKLAADDPRLSGATIYSSLEPCSARASRPRTCTQLILDAGIPRIVYAWREPEVFVDGQGAELLEAAGRDVVQIPDLAPLVRATNAHLLEGRHES
jgi:pyrimidine deaminase RibD-like protein